MTTDSINIDSFTSWNNDAFRLLYKYYYRALVNFSMQIVISSDEAEDVVQSVFTVLLEHKYNFSTIEALEAFLYNSTRNSSLDKLRRKKVSELYIKSLEEQFDEYRPDDGDSIYSEEIYRRLFFLIDQLPDKSREVFLLYIKGMSNQEIADRLNISFETVKTHKRRAMAFLRKNLMHCDLLLIHLGVMQNLLAEVME